jgi:hypothetical protein
MPLHNFPIELRGKSGKWAVGFQVGCLFPTCLYSVVLTASTRSSNESLHNKRRKKSISINVLKYLVSDGAVRQHFDKNPLDFDLCGHFKSPVYSDAIDISSVCFES